MTERPPRRRRRIPAALRMLVSILAVLGAVGAWRAYWQHALLCDLEVITRGLETEPVGPAWLRQWVGEERMRPFDTLGFVDASHMPLADADLARLSGQTGLQSLGLEGTRVTDAGLGALKGAVSLERLSIVDTAITDAGLEHLKGLHNLRELDLEGTRVTNAGLEHLKGLVNLRYLQVGSTHITRAGMADLKRALPHVFIAEGYGSYSYNYGYGLDGPISRSMLRLFDTDTSRHFKAPRPRPPLP